MHPTTLTAATYAEFGRPPLSLQWARLSTNFFSRVAALPDDRPVRRALTAALQLERQQQPILAWSVRALEADSRFQYIRLRSRWFQSFRFPLSE